VTSIIPLLAHIGSPNNPWIGVMTIAALALLVIFVLVAFHTITMEAPGDLLLPPPVLSVTRSTTKAPGASRSAW
jgi:hypothetical protein